MKTKFTKSMLRIITAGKKFNAKKRVLCSFIAILISCYTITSYAQVGNTKPGKPALSHKPDKFHFPWPWLTTGNSGTDTSFNFLGTKDAQPLIFRVNNQRSGLIDLDEFTNLTAFGYQTLINNVPSDIDGNTGGIGNSAFGYKALTSNISGELNTAVGQLALVSNTEGDINTAVGAYSLISNTTGAFNTAIGSFTLNSNTEGGFNTATGDYALNSNTTGSFNIANGGSFTMTGNTEGSENIATGVASMTSNTTGNDNVAYGVLSLASNTTGNNNMAFGSYADVTAGDLNNATAIGAGALVDASNKVRIGNTDVTSIGGEVGWTSYSDERIKDNIQENVPGLEFIKALRPVTYHFNVAKENALLGVKDIGAKNIIMPELKGIKIPALKGIKMPAVNDMPSQKLKDIKAEGNHEIEKTQFTGFLAQDVEKAANNIGYDFSGIDKSGKIMGLRYSDFVVPLVKAVQELSKQNEDLQKQINELKAIMNNANSNAKSSVTLSDGSLEQNKPNPFNKTTTIAYTLPQKYSNAQIVITDDNGKMLKRMTVSGTGKGIMNIDAVSFSAGIYNYSLIVDKRVLSSKQMILEK